VLCSQTSFISCGLRFFEDLRSLQNLKHKLPAEFNLIPFAEANEQKSLVLREQDHIEADTRNLVY